jgi:hypothetical protein
MGFKSPPEHIVRVHATSKWLKVSYLRHRLFYVNNVTNILILTFCDAAFSLSVVTTTKSHNRSEKLSLSAWTFLPFLRIAIRQIGRLDKRGLDGVQVAANVEFAAAIRLNGL